MLKQARKLLLTLAFAGLSVVHASAQSQTLQPNNNSLLNQLAPQWIVEEITDGLVKLIRFVCLVPKYLKISRHDWQI